MSPHKHHSYHEQSRQSATDGSGVPAPDGGESSVAGCLELALERVLLSTSRWIATAPMWCAMAPPPAEKAGGAGLRSSPRRHPSSSASAAMAHDNDSIPAALRNALFEGVEATADADADDHGQNKRTAAGRATAAAALAARRHNCRERDAVLSLLRGSFPALLAGMLQRLRDGRAPCVGPLRRVIAPLVSRKSAPLPCRVASVRMLGRLMQLLLLSPHPHHAAAVAAVGSAAEAAGARFGGAGATLAVVVVVDAIGAALRSLPVDERVESHVMEVGTPGAELARWACALMAAATDVLLMLKLDEPGQRGIGQQLSRQEQEEQRATGWQPNAAQLSLVQALQRVTLALLTRRRVCGALGVASSEQQRAALNAYNGCFVAAARWLQNAALWRAILADGVAGGGEPDVIGIGNRSTKLLAIVEGVFGWNGGGGKCPQLWCSACGHALCAVGSVVSSMRGGGIRSLIELRHAWHGRGPGPVDTAQTGSAPSALLLSLRPPMLALALRLVFRLPGCGGTGVRAATAIGSMIRECGLVAAEAARRRTSLAALVSIDVADEPHSETLTVVARAAVAVLGCGAAGAEDAAEALCAAVRWLAEAQGEEELGRCLVAALVEAAEAAAEASVVADWGDSGARLLSVLRFAGVRPGSQAWRSAADILRGLRAMETWRRHCDGPSAGVGGGVAAVAAMWEMALEGAVRVAQRSNALGLQGATQRALLSALALLGHRRFGGGSSAAASAAGAPFSVLARALQPLNFDAGPQAGGVSAVSGGCGACSSECAAVLSALASRLVPTMPLPAAGAVNGSTVSGVGLGTAAVVAAATAAADCPPITAAQLQCAVRCFLEAGKRWQACCAYVDAMEALRCARSLALLCCNGGAAPAFGHSASAEAAAAIAETSVQQQTHVGEATEQNEYFVVAFWGLSLNELDSNGRVFVYRSRGLAVDTVARGGQQNDLAQAGATPAATALRARLRRWYTDKSDERVAALALYWWRAASNADGADSVSPRLPADISSSEVGAAFCMLPAGPCGDDPQQLLRFAIPPAQHADNAGMKFGAAAFELRAPFSALDRRVEVRSVLRHDPPEAVRIPVPEQTSL